MTQAGVGAAMDKLQGLQDELGFANAPGAALDVEVSGRPRDIGSNICLHPSQRGEGAEIQIAAINKRLQMHKQRMRPAGRLAHPARLHQGIALPGTTVGFVVVLQRRCRDRNRP